MLAARLVVEREVRVRELITHRFALEEALRAIELASRPAADVLKVMVEMRSLPLRATVGRMRLAGQGGHICAMWRR